MENIQETPNFQPRNLPEAIGVSEAFLEFQENLSRVAKVDRPVLIIGERGTGKELAASRLHYLSERWEGPMVALNCAALAESVLESELFGHEKGAFTGASERRLGRFELAEEGTLFLDEIGLISIPIQEKILRAVEYRSFERLGSSDSIRVDARIVGATNADLPAMVKTGKFKDDLLDRLSFEVLYLPPLRARKEDILYLARHFGAQMAFELGRDEPPQFSASAERRIEAYRWPGNIRELKNVVERSVYRSAGGVIDEVEFDPFTNPYAENLQSHKSDAALSEPERETNLETLSLSDEVTALEIRRMREALRACRNRQTEAADRLGLTYHQFRNLYRKYKSELK